MAKPKGLLVTLEGTDGSGKSTQARLLAQALETEGHRVLLTREPGGSPRSARIRALLLDPRLRGLDPEAELLLFAADRRQHVADTLEPALEQGRLVLCDRFTDSTTAYQGAAGLPAAVLERFNRFAAHGLKPDLTLFFDLPPETGLKRARAARGRGDRIEAQDLAYFRRVRSGFLSLARREPRRVKRIAVLGRSPEKICGQALSLLKPLLASRSRR